MTNSSRAGLVAAEYSADGPCRRQTVSPSLLTTKRRGVRHRPSA